MNWTSSARRLANGGIANLVLAGAVAVCLVAAASVAVRFGEPRTPAKLTRAVDCSFPPGRDVPT